MSREENFQQTISEPAGFAGIALHTARKVKIRLLPAEVNTGIIFRRIDLEGRPEIKADPFNVVSTRRCTGLGLSVQEDSPRVHTVEHLMAAIWAMGIDNLVIELDNAETPVGDGSALPFVNLIEKT